MKCKFKGILNQPIREPGFLARAFGYGQSKEVQNAVAKAIQEYFFQQRLKRIHALADYYGVDLISSGAVVDQPLCELLIKVAEDFEIPGFMVGPPPQGAGRPRGKQMAEGFDLYHSINELVERRGLSVAAACRILSKKKPWKGKSPAALQERYRRVRGELLRPRPSTPPELKELYEKLSSIAD
jgi:hypothetical protein